MMKKFMTIVMMGAMVLTSCSEQKKVDVQGEWNIVTLNGKTVESTQNPYIGFNTNEGKIYGNSGCNYINGTFNLAEENVINLGHVATTMMSCPNMELEQEVLAALAKVGKVNAVEKGLSLLDAEGNVLMELEKRAETVALEAIAGQWNMVKVYGQEIPTDLDGTPYLIFDAEKKGVAGLAGYNHIQGSVVLNEQVAGSMQFENVASTRKMGPNMNFEMSVMKALEAVRSFGLVSNGQLALFDVNGAIAIVLEKAE